MKLRNKKTGKIWHMPRLRQPTVQEDDISFFACIGEHGCSRCELFSYKSLAELNEEWEDYKPAEPLIKDEKIRKEVRAWANANGFHVARYSSVNNCFCHQGEMMFVEPTWELEQLEKLGYKTITELCGEEEE